MLFRRIDATHCMRLLAQVDFKPRQGMCMGADLLAQAESAQDFNQAVKTMAARAPRLTLNAQAYALPGDLQLRKDWRPCQITIKIDSFENRGEQAHGIILHAVWNDGLERSLGFLANPRMQAHYLNMVHPDLGFFVETRKEAAKSSCYQEIVFHGLNILACFLPQDLLDLPDGEDFLSVALDLARRSLCYFFDAADDTINAFLIDAAEDKAVAGGQDVVPVEVDDFLREAATASEIILTQGALESMGPRIKVDPHAATIAFACAAFSCGERWDQFIADIQDWFAAQLRIKMKV